jgi:hypothetical protein
MTLAMQRSPEIRPSAPPEGLLARVYHGPGQRTWEEVPDPEITDEAT